MAQRTSTVVVALVIAALIGTAPSAATDSSLSQTLMFEPNDDPYDPETISAVATDLGTPS